jgi:hypothetical protein
MTDVEYNRFLAALAGKHLRLSGQPLPNYQPQLELNQLAQTNRLLKAVQCRPEDQELSAKLGQDLQRQPLERVRLLMDQAGMLDAIDDAPEILLREFRRSAVPLEDQAFLKAAGFSEDEIEISFVVAEAQARNWAYPSSRPSRVLEDANEALSVPDLLTNPTKKKRKILNGIGKILGGAVAGTGNTLIAMGTMIVPAAGAAAIASGGLAISSILAGLGDLRGE